MERGYSAPVMLGEGWRRGDSAPVMLGGGVERGPCDVSGTEGDG